jgi:hypothetical protein
MGYTKIASTTVGSGGVSSVTFSSIPQTYKDLVIKMCAGNTAGLSVITFGFNGVTSAYTYRAIRAGASAASSFTESSAGVGPIWAGYNSYQTSVSSNTEAYIPNYTGSAYKSMSVDASNEQNNNSDAYLLLNAGLWSNTAAITSVTITASAAQYSTFYLYGVI